jgi:acetylornithine deacetylase/succinyl-diaminopimelate desuccinylase-like protein
VTRTVPAAPAGGPPPVGARRSDRLDPAAWAAASDEVVETLRTLIRIPSLNPPDPPGPELEAARRIGDMLADAGLRPTVYEPYPGRGSVVARLSGDGSGGAPLLLLSHLDVVPAPADGWTHDPFAGDVADGYVYGRGAVDMKNLVAMEIEVLRLLAAETRAAGRDPGRDPVPGLRRDLLFACTADEEAGGIEGAAWLAATHPEDVRAAAAINESGAVSVTVGDRRLYPIQVAEKGVATYRLRFRGAWGHGSMPRPDNAILLAAEATVRLAAAGPVRVTPVMARFLDGAADAIAEDQPEAARILKALGRGATRATTTALAGICSAVYVRALDALLRDTISPGVVHGGLKWNVVPGEAILEVDCRRLPGTSEPDMAAAIRGRLGPDLAAVTELDLIVASEPVEATTGGPLYPLLAEVVRDHDPAAVPLPAMAPYSTDAKHLLGLGIPTYGFSPLRQPPDELYLDRFHGIDERVSLDALRWGLPVLYDAVRRFCE